MPSSPPAVAAPTAGGLEGTVWAGTDSDGDYYVFRYLPGGVLKYTSPTDTHVGTWRQTGEKVTMSVGNGYSQYTGTIAGGTIRGTASNKADHTWQWTVTKQ